MQAALGSNGQLSADKGSSKLGRIDPPRMLKDSALAAAASSKSLISRGRPDIFSGVMTSDGIAPSPAAHELKWFHRRRRSACFTTPQPKSKEPYGQVVKILRRPSVCSARRVRKN
jgi:hypothetical protein